MAAATAAETPVGGGDGLVSVALRSVGTVGRRASSRLARVGNIAARQSREGCWCTCLLVLSGRGDSTTMRFLLALVLENTIVWL